MAPLTPQEEKRFFPNGPPRPSLTGQGQKRPKPTLDQKLQAPVIASSKAADDALSDRLVIQVKALRGDFSPQDSATDTERKAKLSAALIQWPASVTLAVVGRNEPGFRESIVQVVTDATCDGSSDDVVVKEQFRAGGKFVSLKVTATLPTPEVVDDLHARFKADPRVKMSF